MKGKNIGMRFPFGEHFKWIKEWLNHFGDITPNLMMWKTAEFRLPDYGTYRIVTKEPGRELITFQDWWNLGQHFQNWFNGWEWKKLKSSPTEKYIEELKKENRELKERLNAITKGNKVSG